MFDKKFIKKKYFINLPAYFSICYLMVQKIILKFYFYDRDNIEMEKNNKINNKIKKFVLS